MRFATFSCKGIGVDNRVQVTLLPSRRAFLTYLRGKVSEVSDKSLSGTKCAAKMLGYSTELLEKGYPDAELVFYEERFNAGNVAHEVAHALIRIFKCADKDAFADDGDEEAFATLSGDLVELIMEWHGELGK